MKDGMRKIVILGGMWTASMLIVLRCSILSGLLEVPQTDCSKKPPIISYWDHFYSMNSWERLKPLANGLFAASIKDQVGWLDSDSISPLFWVGGKGCTGLVLKFTVGEGISEPESCQL